MISLNILLVMFGITIAIAHFADILIDEEAAKNLIATQQHSVAAAPPPVAASRKQNSQKTSSTTDEQNQSAPCQMEFQVIKRTIGHCIKLGRTGYGCVSGNYLHPFHPECIT